MRIVITGGAGMLGIALCKEFIDGGHEVIAIDDMSRDPDEGHARMIALKEIGGEQDKLTLLGFTIANEKRSIALMTHAFSDADVVINAAADVGGVFYNQGHNNRIYAANSVLQAIPLAMAEMCNVKTFVQISSVCVYEPTTNPNSLREHAEKNKLGELSIDNAGYAMAKRNGETLAMASKIDNVIVVRPTNMFGPYDHFDDKAHVIPSIIKKFCDDKDVVISSPGFIERDFLYSEQAAMWIKALALCPEQYVNRQVFNLPRSSGGRQRIDHLVGNIEAVHNLHSYPVDSVSFDAKPGSFNEVRRRVNGDKLFNTMLKVYGTEFPLGMSFDGQIAATIDYYISKLTREEKENHAQPAAV